MRRTHVQYILSCWIMHLGHDNQYNEHKLKRQMYPGTSKAFLALRPFLMVYVHIK